MKVERIHDLHSGDDGPWREDGPADVEASLAAYCSHCEAPLEAGTLRCHRCGKWQPEVAPPVLAESPAPRSRGRPGVQMPIWVLLLAVALLTLWIWSISQDVAWGALIYLATWSWIPGLLLLRARLLGREQPGHRGELSHAAQVLLALLLIGLVGGGFAIALRVSHWPASGHYVAAAMMAFLCCLLCVLGILLLLTRL